VSLLGGLCTLALAVAAPGTAAAVALIAAIGLFGATYALLMAHARTFMPLHLTGRGITLMNFFIIGGVGLGQMVTGRIHSFAFAKYTSLPVAYDAVFLYYAIASLAALAIYAFSRDAGR